MNAESAAPDLLAAAAILRAVAAKWEAAALKITERGEVDAATALDVRDARELLAMRT